MEQEDSPFSKPCSEAIDSERGSLTEQSSRELGPDTGDLALESDELVVADESISSDLKENILTVHTSNKCRRSLSNLGYPLSPSKQENTQNVWNSKEEATLFSPELTEKRVSPIGRRASLKRSASSPAKDERFYPRLTIDSKENSIMHSSPHQFKLGSLSVCYLYSEEYIRLCNKLPKIPNRASMVHSLLEAYGLLDPITVLRCRKATQHELTSFHTTDYIEYLQKINDEDDSEKVDEMSQEYGMGYDCPSMPGVYDLVGCVAGATIQAAQCLLDGTTDVAINWFGGWHHAKRDEAAGFCYVNDVVLGILKLKEKFNRIMYIDIDLHHGDGVENAFSFTSKVMTVSLHKYAPGFFPSTGNQNDIGIGRGKFYTVNVPLYDGIQDVQYNSVFNRVLNEAKRCYNPEVIVLQCGVDTISGDPMCSFNLTPHGIGKCLKTTLDWKLPMLVLGGGGYNIPHTARCWAYLTSIVLGQEIPSEIPEHEYFTEYGPDYQLEIEPSLRKNHNSDEYISNILTTISGNLQKIPSPTS